MAVETGAPARSSSGHRIDHNLLNNAERIARTRALLPENAVFGVNLFVPGSPTPPERFAGYLAEVGDVDTMARYAIELLTNEERLREMGKQARAVAQERFCST